MKNRFFFCLSELIKTLFYWSFYLKKKKGKMILLDGFSPYFKYLCSYFDIYRYIGKQNMVRNLLYIGTLGFNQRNLQFICGLVQKLEKMKDSNRRSRQLEKLTDKLRECKSYITSHSLFVPYFSWCLHILLYPCVLGIFEFLCLLMLEWNGCWNLWN